MSSLYNRAGVKASKSGDGLHHFKNRNRCDGFASKYFVGSVLDGINIFALFSCFFA